MSTPLRIIAPFVFMLLFLVPAGLLETQPTGLSAVGTVPVVHTAGIIFSPHGTAANNALRTWVDRDRWFGFLAWLSRLPKPKPVITYTTYTHSVGSRNSHGPHSDAWWHGVAICEQGGRNDPYFGYFSYMDGSAAGKSWAEQVAMANRTIARFGEDILYGGAWAHTCVMAGYRASPGG